MEKKKYTKAGYQALLDELNYLVTVKKEENKKEISAARAFGDLSENSEYDAAKQEQAIIERTSSMNDEALKELMYDAVERINVTDNQNIEIVWKFDDLFATA